MFGLDLPVDDWAKEEGIADEEIFSRVERRADEHMAAKVAQWGPDVMRYVEKSILLQTLDHLWREHIVMLDHLRQVIGLRGYGQRDPLNEYKGEAFKLFEAMSQSLREAVTAQLMRVEIQAAPPPQQPAPLPAMQAHKIDPTTGEDEMALAMAGAETLARHGIGAAPWRRRVRRRRSAIRTTRQAGARSAATRSARAAQARNSSTATGDTPNSRSGVRHQMAPKLLILIVDRLISDYWKPPQRLSNEPAGTTGWAPLRMPPYCSAMAAATLACFLRRERWCGRRRMLWRLGPVVLATCGSVLGRGRNQLCAFLASPARGSRGRASVSDRQDRRRGVVARREQVAEEAGVRRRLVSAVAERDLARAA